MLCLNGRPVVPHPESCHLLSKLLYKKHFDVALAVMEEEDKPFISPEVRSINSYSTPHKPFISAEVCSVSSHSTPHKSFTALEVSSIISPPLPHPKNEWRSGLFHHIPTLGLAALLGAGLCTAMMIFVLLHSHGRNVDTWKETWKFSTPVWLSVLSSIATNLLLSALGVGCVISWWRKCMSRNATIEDLERQWRYGDTVMGAFGGLLRRDFDRLAVACVVMSIVQQANGPLLQGASTMDTQSAHGPTNLEIPQLVQAVSPYENTEAFFTSSNLSTVLTDWVQNAPIKVSDGSCRGKCSGPLQGVGWNWVCSNGTVPWGNKSPGYQDSHDTKFQVFGANVDLIGPAGNQTLLLTSTYKTQPQCGARLMYHTCNLAFGNVEYPVVLDGQSLSLNQTTNISNDLLIGISYPNTSEYEVYLWVETLWDSVGAQFNSSAYLEFQPGEVGEGFEGEVVSRSNAYYDYMNRPQFVSADWDRNCSVTFRDPMPDMLQAARELLFRMAYNVGESRKDINPTYRWQDVYTSPAYRTNKTYMNLAVATMGSGILSVALTFCGYWKLGRTFSLSPIEIAKAFNAPMLKNQDSNANAKDLVKIFRRTRIRYGEVIRVEGRTMEKELEIESGKEARRTLEMADPSVIRKPGHGNIYDG